MSEDEFLAALTGLDSDLRIALEALRSTGRPFCLIGGLAVNHYVEPVVTLDADFAVVAAAGLSEGFQARQGPRRLDPNLRIPPRRPHLHPARAHSRTR